MCKIVFLYLILAVSGGHGSIFGYHIRVGVPKALELLQFEGVHSLVGLRIIGGSLVPSASDIPYQAGIITRLKSGLQSVCGGSLISHTRVLTAAHCWWDGQSQATQFTIVLGSLTIFTGGTRVDTTDVVIHPNWNSADITNDVMLAKITSVTYNNIIQAIPLPTVSDANIDLDGLTGTISGFGKTTDGQTTPTTSLYHRTVDIITNAVCQNSLQAVELADSHLCTNGVGNVGTCDGDSGGPLTVVINKKKTLVGVVSFGLDESCASGNPSVFTRVTAFTAWISANM